jgi:hypothetical protein
VTNAADSGVNTLRAHMSNINCHAITFDLTAMGTDTIALASTLPVVGRPLVIEGPGIDSLTVRGNNTFPLIIVNISGGDVAIGGLTLTGGHAAAGYGGNLRSAGGNLTLTDLALTGGTAANQGGAGAYLSNGTSTLTRVLVSGNSAPGGPTFGSGAGLFIDEFFGPSTVTITDSRIVGNVATNNSGGGIALWRTNGGSVLTLDLRLVNTVVGTAASPNNASSGAGIYNWFGTLTLTDSTVEGN